jgi:zinc finger protein
MGKLEGQTCPVCMNKTLTLTEELIEIPFFGKAYIFSMECSDCGFRKSDVEAAEPKEPVKYTFEISSAKDLNVRVVKSSSATIKLPEMKVKIESAENSDGYVANVEKILNELQQVVVEIRDTEESKAKKKKARQLVEQILDLKEGKGKTTLVIEDPTGNSAIISEKAKKEPLKTAKK